MQKEYRVMDCRSKVVETTEFVVRAGTPEEAAWLAIGETLTRGGRPSDLRVRVYSQVAGQPLTMVRLYSKGIDRGQY